MSKLLDMTALPTDSFTFFNEKGERIDHLTGERTEQLQAYEYVPEDAQGVLELGARYGTVTAAISKKLKNKSELKKIPLQRNHEHQ